MTYDSGMSVVRVDTGNNYQGHTDIQFTAKSNEKYIRFVMTNNSTSAAITPDFNSGFTLIVDSFDATVNATVKELTKDLSQNRKVGTVGVPEFVIHGPFSDMTWVNDTFVGFSGTATDDLDTTEPSTCKIYTYGNGFGKDKEITSSNTFYHKFGHCNTVDYSAINDCLIMGNGSGAYNLPGKIFIFPNFSTLIQDTSRGTFDNP